VLPLGALFAFLGQQLGKLLNLAFAWATTALFGQVPSDKRIFLSLMALCALLWPVVLAGVLVPSVATFLLAFVTLPGWLDVWVRPVMLALAVALPLAVGYLGTRLHEPAERGRDLAAALLRGYPTALGLFIVLAWMLVLAPLNQLRAILLRHESAHVAIAIQPGGYETVVRDLHGALVRAGITASAARAHWAFELPGRVLAVLGGPRVRALVPRELMVLRTEDFQVVVHPMDLSMRGRRGPLARGRAAIARELTFTAANQTWSREAQEIENALADVANGKRDDLAAIGRRIESIELDYQQWEILYRLLLQVRLRVSATESDAVVPDREPAPPLGDRLAAVRDAVSALVNGAPSR
jgi:hypothetical protein